MNLLLHDSGSQFICTKFPCQSQSRFNYKAGHKCLDLEFVSENRSLSAHKMFPLIPFNIRHTHCFPLSANLLKPKTENNPQGNVSMIQQHFHIKQIPLQLICKLQLQTGRFNLLTENEVFILSLNF